MNETYNKLKRLVEAGDLSITYIDAPPRTVSTALFRSLSQLYDGSIFEPLKIGKDNAEHTFEDILETANKAGVYDTNKQKPVKVLVKVIASNISPEEFKNMMLLCEDYIAIVRDPQLQCDSLLNKAADNIDKRQPKLQLVGNTTTVHLGSVVKAEKIIACDDFSRTGWEKLKQHFEIAKKRLGDKCMVVDGFILRASPEKTMVEILDRLGMEHNQETVAKLANGWSEESGKHITEIGDRSVPDSEFLKVVANASGYTPPLDATKPLSEFPDKYQEHIKSKAIPIYLEMLQSANRVGGKNLSELESMFNAEIDGVKLIDRNPVSAYSLVSSLDKMTIPTKEKNDTLASYRNKYPEYADTFSIIDAAKKGHTKEVG